MKTEENDDIQDVRDGFVAVKLNEVESQRHHGRKAQYRKQRSARVKILDDV
jgi:hypothetical protein